MRGPIAVGTLLVLALAAGRPVDAASAGASVTARVTQSVVVQALLGAPLSINDILDALRAPAGPSTGSVLIRLAQIAPALTQGVAAPGFVPDAAPGMQAALAGALTLPLSGTLQRELVAAVSLIGQEAGTDAQPSITVAFN